MWRSTISARWCANSRSWPGVSSCFCGVAKQLLEFPQARDGLMMSEIEMQWRDRDIAVLNGLEVGPFTGMPGRLFAADPVILSSARIQPLDHSLGVDTLAKFRHANTIE